MKSSSQSYRILNLDDKWYVAFHDKWYNDFVIEFSQSFATHEEAAEAVKHRKIKPSNTPWEK